MPTYEINKSGTAVLIKAVPFDKDIYISKLNVTGTNQFGEEVVETMGLIIPPDKQPKKVKTLVDKLIDSLDESKSQAMREPYRLELHIHWLTVSLYKIDDKGVAKTLFIHNTNYQGSISGTPAFKYYLSFNQSNCLIALVKADYKTGLNAEMYINCCAKMDRPEFMYYENHFYIDDFRIKK